MHTHEQFYSSCGFLWQTEDLQTTFKDEFDIKNEEICKFLNESVMQTHVSTKIIRTTARGNRGEKEVEQNVMYQNAVCLVYR
jgi:hypothetical protein